MVWEIGSGYFGARDKDGHFDPEKFRDKAANDAVKMTEIKKLKNKTVKTKEVKFNKIKIKKLYPRDTSQSRGTPAV